MKHLQRTFQQLSNPEKALVISLLLSFFFTFFPWFSQISITAIPNAVGKYEDVKTFSGYEGITAVMGWFHVFFVITIIFSVFLSNSNRIVQSFVHKYYWWYLFLAGESLFILILTALINTAYAIQFTSAGIQYGLIFCIILNIIALFSSHFFFLHRKKIQIKKIFASQMQSSVQIEPETIAPEPRQPRVNTPLPEKKESQLSLSDYGNNNL